MKSTLLRAVIALLSVVSHSAAQDGTLQLKGRVERPLSPKDAAHHYAVPTKGNQALTVTVEQQGIDVVVTVLGPDGKQLVEVDSAHDDDGTAGAEVARVAALAPGEYRIRVAPFERPDAKPSAKYTISLSEVRDLTVAERTNAESERQIAALEDQWEQARDKPDIPILSGILRDDGFGINPMAETRSRVQIVKGWEGEVKRRAERGSTRAHTLSHKALKVAGDVAVSTGRFLLTTGTKDQSPDRTSGQFVPVWAKNEQGWKLVGDYTFPFGRVPSERKETVIAVEPSALSVYAGTYREESSPSRTHTFTVENGVLHEQMSHPGHTTSKRPLRAISDTTFSGAGWEITFVRSSRGEVGEVLFLWEGPAIRAFRVK